MENKKYMAIPLIEYELLQSIKNNFDDFANGKKYYAESIASGFSHGGDKINIVNFYTDFELKEIADEKLLNDLKSATYWRDYYKAEYERLKSRNFWHRIFNL